MGSAIVTAFLDAMTAVFAGVGDGIMTVFNTVIYNSTTGLTPLAEWGLIFMGIAFALGIFYAIFRKIG